MAETIKINCSRDFLSFLETMEENTKNFFDSNARSMTNIPELNVELNTDLRLSDRMCKHIRGAFKYFRGVFDGKGHTISAMPEKSTSLFSSIYFSKIKDLTIHNIDGSRGFILADDSTQSEINNVSLTGTIYLSESLGGMFRTGESLYFKNCHVNIVTKTLTSKLIDESLTESEDKEPPHFGGFMGVNLGGVIFHDCSLSGELSSEVAVGGFCAIARDTLFRECNIEELTVSGKREVGLFVGRGSRSLEFKRCIVYTSKLSANHWVGYLVGKTYGSIEVSKLLVEDCFIKPKGTLTHAGGIAGSADKISLTDSCLEGSITANIILAGVCPDVSNISVINNKFNLSLTAVGYPPMMTHGYKLFRSDFLTGSGKEITVVEDGNTVDINLVELSGGGIINPFEESLV